MNKYSRVRAHKYGKYTFHFRYNYESSKLEYVSKADEAMLAYLRETVIDCQLKWLRSEAEENLKVAEETGYMVIDAQGLNAEDWKESPDYFMDVYSEDICCMIAI